LSEGGVFLCINAICADKKQVLKKVRDFEKKVLAFSIDL